MLTTTTIARAVAAGAKLLDGFEPHWFNRVDLERLNFAIGGRDVLSLLLGKEFAGAFREVITSRPPMERASSWEYGFTLPADEQHSARAVRSLWKLTDAWQVEIEFRRLVSSLRN